MRSMRVAALVVLALAAATARAELYRWTDAEGHTHVTDTPPPASAKNVQKRSSAASSASAPAEPYSLQQAMKNYPVTLYSAPSCEGCAPARQLLNQRGIPFSEKSVQTQPVLDDLKKATGGD